MRYRTKVTKGPGSKAAGLALAFKLIEAAQQRRRAVNAPHLVALVRAGARFERGKLVERPATGNVVPVRGTAQRHRHVLGDVWPGRKRILGSLSGPWFLVDQAHEQLSLVLDAVPRKVSTAEPA